MDSADLTGRIARRRTRVNESRGSSVKAVDRVVCGAKRHRDGQPCEALSVPGKRRCRFHGGMSTGPRTPEGKRRAEANLRARRTTDG
ncbi:HGGxSTG domain-containing protein [Luteimonas sp. YGD11-2]|uniref:HGGxSTG domain-containing protein n=1 Tax=Luteimonas sp. YGD11-2 TaxID=2508168 RepID=UPI00100BA0C4|nr:HGGxSTG domain-containing protein [Luteimonas sp. YGD11-2]